jgi:hypothetical protein
MMRGIGPALLFGCMFVASAARGDDGMYRYVGKNGRVVFTNMKEQVPLEQRPQATVDLSHRSLNTEIGNELQQRLAAEHAELTKTPYCKHLVASANANMFERAWDDFAPLIVCCGAVLLLFLFSPAALRRFGAPAWAKTLGMAIPILGVSGLVMFLIASSNKALTSLKEQAAPCMQESFTRLSGAQNAQELQTKLVAGLKQEVEKLESIAHEGSVSVKRAVNR